jgi:hypothetical protein
MGTTRNTGYLQNIVQYDASNNITLPAKLAITGTVAINNTTPYDTTQYSLDVNGGLIIKNINKTAQFVLINSNPATGGNNAFVVHTVGGTSGSSYADIQGYYGTSIAGSTVLRLNPLGGNILIGSLIGTGTRVVVADATGVLSTQAAQTLGDLNGVPTSRTITINGTTFDLSANRTYTINSMVYPGAGIAVSTGTAWGTSLTDNSSNWNTAFGWGNHAGLYSLLNHTHTFASLTSKPTTLVGYGITDAATSAQGTNADTAYGWGNHASGGYVTLTGTQTISGVKTFSTYQLMDVAILIKHGSNTSTGGYTGIGSVAAGLTINLGIGTTASLLFNTSASYSYTFPAASGTIALTSDLSTYATQTYVGTAIANLVASSPAALDTLNELAAALGNDAAFSTTVSTALGNRLRVDTNAQGLSATLQGYGRTNLGLGTAATSNTGDFVAYRTFGTAANSATGDFVAYRTFGTAANNNTGDFAAASHTHSIANVTGLQTALDGKQASGSYAASSHSHIISDVTGLQTALDGKQASLGFTPYNSTNPSGYISSYTETSTLANVTARGASTSTALTFSGGFNDGYITYSLAQINRAAGFVELQYASGGGVKMFGAGATPITFATTGGATFSGAISASNLSGTNTGDQTNISGNAATASNASALGGYAQDFQTVVGTGDYLIIRNQAASKLSLASWASVQSGLGLGSLAYSSATIPTNNNQLTNGAGYITSSGSITGSAGSTALVTIDNSVVYGRSGLQFAQSANTAGNTASNHNTPTGDWWHVIRMNHANGAGYYADLAISMTTNLGLSRRVISNGAQLSNWVTILDALNYNSYSPTLTGGSASGTWGISISGNAATATSAGSATTATNLQAVDATQIKFNSVSNIDYSTMTFMSRAWSAVQGANGLAYNFTTHNNNGNGGYGALQIYYGEGGYVSAPTSFRAPAFYASSTDGVINQENGTSAGWRGRILSKNSGADLASFLGTYGTIAGVFAHNNALNAWVDLYVNTVNASTGGNVRLPSTTYINGYAAVYASGTWGISITGNAATFNNGSLYISTVNGNTLNSGFSNAGDGSDIWINYRGYNDDQSYFRDFRVGNGKGSVIALFTGSTGNLAVTGSLSAVNITGIGEGNFGPDSGSDNGIRIRYANDGSGYGRIRFHQAGSNHQTIHSFSAAWQGGSLAGQSSGGINIAGQNGVTFGGWNVVDGYVATGGTAWFRADVTAYSDARVKENIRPIENALQKVINSRGVLYDRIDSGTKNNIGFVAQELEVNLPELVMTDSDDLKSVKYQNMTAVLVEAIKEQQTQIESQKSEIDELKDLVQQLINR